MNNMNQYEKEIEQYHDLHKSRPFSNGVYKVLVPFMGKMRLTYKNGSFYWDNGNVVSDDLCRWWK